MIEKQTKLRPLTRSAQPLIHCITNPISIHDCANIILAAGGRPIMAEHPAEVAEITRSSHALALNLGNITDVRMKSMPESLKTAASLHIPVMLDLVGTACSNLRYEFANKLMNIHMPELLKGNMSELLAMSGQTAHAIGIDAGDEDTVTDINRCHLQELFQEKAAQWNTTLLITGKEDMIVSANKCSFIKRGTPAMSQITGTLQLQNLVSPAKELKKTAPAPEASRWSCLISFTSCPYDKQIKKGAYFLAALFIYLIFSTA